MKTPILGGAYVLESPNAACARMVNLYPESIPDGGKEAAWLQRTPGLAAFKTIDVSRPVRGMWCDNTPGDPMFVVIGRTLYKVADLGANPESVPGTIYGGNNRVIISDNGNELFIAADPYGYIYDKSLNTLTALDDTSTVFPGSSSVAYLDGYFIFNEPKSQKLWATTLLEGKTIDPLDFASAEGAPDDVVCVVSYNRELWVFGVTSTEVWTDVGGNAFPLARLDGAFFEVGCISKHSVVKLDNRIFWLARDPRGAAMIYASRGYNGERVSTHAIEQQIQKYGGLDQAYAYAYQQNGHTFYVITFPAAGVTFAYDVATQVWHERAGYAYGEFVRHRAAFACSFNEKIIVGDYEKGILYYLDTGTYDDAGTQQRWLRSWRALATGTNKLVRAVHHSLQLDCESGVGTVDGPGSDPQVMLRWSDDGGHTWSNEHWARMGGSGQTALRVLWRRLGQTGKLRDRVYEVSGTDPVRLAIMGAELLGVEEDS